MSCRLMLRDLQSLIVVLVGMCFGVLQQVCFPVFVSCPVAYSRPNMPTRLVTRLTRNRIRSMNIIKNVFISYREKSPSF